MTLYAGDEFYDDDVTSGNAGFAFADEGDDCTRCGGDGFEECDDRIQCLRSYHIGDEHECGACGGSGLAKDQTVW